MYHIGGCMCHDYSPSNENMSEEEEKEFIRKEKEKTFIRKKEKKAFAEQMQVEYEKKSIIKGKLAAFRAFIFSYFII